MEKIEDPPIINFERFKKSLWGCPDTPNYTEAIWCAQNTYHQQAKNFQIEGVEICWSGNPFDLKKYCDYILKK